MERKRLAVIFEIIVVLLLLAVLVALTSTIVGLGGSRPAKMALMVAVYVGIGGVPLLALLIRRIPFSILGFVKERIGRQLLIGLAVFAVTISAAVFIPLLLGVDKADIFSTKSVSTGVLVFRALYSLLCVGFGEELAFRGYLYGRLQSLTAVSWLPMVLSAVLFGLWHFPNTLSLVNVAATAVLGLLYGFCRWKVRGCSLLSLSVAHGLHDAAIIVLTQIFL